MIGLTTQVQWKRLIDKEGSKGLHIADAVGYTKVQLRARSYRNRRGWALEDVICGKWPKVQRGFVVYLKYHVPISLASCV